MGKIRRGRESGIRWADLQELLLERSRGRVGPVSIRMPRQEVSGQAARVECFLGGLVATPPRNE